MCSNGFGCFVCLCCPQQLIDDFEDVTLEEKEFMKLWNRHIYTYRFAVVHWSSRVVDPSPMYHHHDGVST